jgi:predicted ferric reductase
MTTATFRSVLLWLVVLGAITLPFGIATTSPLLEWRSPVYIIAGFAGIVALAALILQPLLVAGKLAGFKAQTGRSAHRWLGTVLCLAVLLHVGGLWITSPPDVIDALLFASPTRHAIWGVIAMWAVFGAAAIVPLRRRIPLRIWRITHTVLILTVLIGSIIHALLIEGTMGAFSKAALCALIVGSCLWVIYERKVWKTIKRRK